MPCLAVVAPVMASMHDWKPTDFTGRHRKLIRATVGSTTSARAAKPYTAKTVARSRVHFLFGVSGSDESRCYLGWGWTFPSTRQKQAWDGKVHPRFGKGRQPRSE